MSDRDRIETKTQADVWATHYGPEATEAARARARAFDDTRSWVDPNGYRLSDRIWNQREQTRALIDQRVRMAINNRESATDLARDLEQFLDPRYKPVRTRAGRIDRRDVIARDGQGVYTKTPTGSRGSYPARRLARTEVTRALGQETMQDAAALGRNIRWSLSPSHPKRDICDDYADRDTGNGRGVYTPQDVPTYPPHPQCLCTLVPVTPPGPTGDADLDSVNKAREMMGLPPLESDGAGWYQVAEEPIVTPYDAAPATSPRGVPRRDGWESRPDWVNDAHEIIDAGIRSEDDIQRLGGIIEDELHTRLGTREISDISDQIRIERANFEDAFAALKSTPIDDDAARAAVNQRIREISARNEALNKQYGELYDRGISYGTAEKLKMRDEARAILAEVRPGFGQSTRSLRADLSGPARGLVNDARADFPSEWVDMMADRMSADAASGNRWVADIANRGFYDTSNRRIAVSGRNDLSRRAVASHELGHMAGDVNPILAHAERSFLFRRRTSETAIQSDSMLKGEISYPDAWLNDYIGRKYPVGDATEVTSMGVQSLFHPSDPGSVDMIADRDYFRFILGVLGGL